MIAAWMLFTLGIGALIFAAAWLIERALVSLGRPVRGVWVVAMIGATAIAAIGAYATPARTSAALPLVMNEAIPNPAFAPTVTQGALPSPSASTSPSSTPGGASSTHGSPSNYLFGSLRTMVDASLLSFPVSESSPLRKLDVPLMTLWAFASVCAALLCAFSIWRMSRERNRWRGENMDGAPVLISHDTGPALVGILNYSVVVPSWALTLDERARQLLLAHEREHARQFDPVLMMAAALFVVIAPWNICNWFFAKRLHLAIELDCDQRVLSKYSDAHEYGTLLLDVAERVLPSAVPVAAFVEYGAPLEKRIGALTKPTARLRAVRALSSGIAAMGLLVVACVAPRPYASLPPAQRASRLASDLNEVLKSDSLGNAVSASQRASIARSVDDAARPSVASRILPVAPRAEVAALDKAEIDRIRRIAIVTAPEAFGSWSRRDSALMLLIDGNGVLLKRASYPVARLGANDDASRAFSSVFMPPDIFRISYATEIAITQGLRSEVMNTPLHVLIARMQSGAATPRRRDEVIPSHSSMVALLRQSHPEVLADTSRNPEVGVLLFGTHGELLRSAAVKMNDSLYMPDGETAGDFNQIAFRTAFGTRLENSVMVESGRTTYFDERTPHDGKPRVLYAVIMSRSEAAGPRDSGPSTLMDGEIAGSSSRGGGLPDQNMMTRMLLGMVESRVPDAFGKWSRGDSAVVFLFDADQQLIDRGTSALAQNAGLPYLADLVSRSLKSISADDIDAVGHIRFTASSAGRELDRPLQVIWGRARRGAVIRSR